MAFLHVLEGDIGAEPHVQLDVDAQVDDRLDLLGDELTGKSILGNSHHHHSTEHVGRFVDRGLVTELSQIVCSGKPAGPTADDADTLCPFHRWRAGDLSSQRSRSSFDPVLVRHKTFQRSNRNGSVDRSPSTCVLARSRAHSPTHRGERVGESRRKVSVLIVPLGDGGDVQPGVGVHRTRRQAGDVGVEEVERLHQIRPRCCATRKPARPANKATPQTTRAIPSRIHARDEATASTCRSQDGNQTVKTTKYPKMSTERNVADHQLTRHLLCRNDARRSPTLAVFPAGSAVGCGRFPLARRESRLVPAISPWCGSVSTLSVATLMAASWPVPPWVCVVSPL